MNAIRINQGLLETHRRAVGQALLSTFGQKLMPFFGSGPHAKSLYARLGFSVVERIRLPWLFAGLGFSGYDRMVKPLTG